jgi:hypothetical protein
MSTETDFTQTQQRAVLGHAVIDSVVLSAVQQLKVIFDENLTASLFKRLCEFVEQNHTQPSVAELRNHCMQFMEVNDGNAISKRLDECLKAANDIRIETLLPFLLLWGERQVFKNQLEKAADVFNTSMDLYNKNGGVAGKKEHEESKALVLDLASELQRVGLAVTGARFDAMSQRSRGEDKERLGRYSRLIPTGLKYLDDATGGGIGPKDLWVISAQTGYGKTQTATAIAQSAGMSGKKVTFFALEAENLELERRIKFTILLQLFNKAYPGNSEFLDGVAWAKGEPKVNAKLKPFEKMAAEIMEQRLKNVFTFYRGYGKYTDKDLERDIFTQARDSDLVIIDHLGYIDLDGNDQNKAVTELMHKLADLAMTGDGCPIVAAAQTRKGDGKQNRKFAPLIPLMEDISGSKAIVTVATNVVMIARVNEKVGFYNGKSTEGSLVEPKSWVKNPTLIQLQKCRAGDRIRYAALCSYSPSLGTYEDPYSIGRMRSGDTEWEPSQAPEWATHATLQVNPIEK